MPVAFTRQGAKRCPAPSGALAQRLAGTEGNAALCKSEAGGRSGRVPQVPQIADQHDAQASRGVVAWHGVPALPTD